MTNLLLFSANMVFIFLKAFQQRNVAHLHYAPIIPLSLLLATAEIYMISTIAILGVGGSIDWHHVISLAVGGGVGCMLSMYVHNKFLGEKK